MVSKLELKKWLLKNRVNRKGDLDLSGLDFSDFNGDVFIHCLKVKKSLHQSAQTVGGNLYQSASTVEGDLHQSFHIVKSNLYQNNQTVGLFLYQEESQLLEAVESKELKSALDKWAKENTDGNLNKAVNALFKFALKEFKYESL